MLRSHANKPAVAYAKAFFLLVLGIWFKPIYLQLDLFLLVFGYMIEVYVTLSSSFSISMEGFKKIVKLKSHKLKSVLLQKRKGETIGKDGLLLPSLIECLANSDWRCSISNFQLLDDFHTTTLHVVTLYLTSLLVRTLHQLEFFVDSHFRVLENQFYMLSISMINLTNQHKTFQHVCPHLHVF